MTKKLKKKKVRKTTKRIMVFGVLSLCVSILVLAGILKSVIDIVDKYQEASNLEDKLATLVDKEDDLNKEIVKLQDPEYLARYAREKYFYSKDNEIIIRIPNE